MIELLVALLVLGVGALGVAGLQLLSLQNNRAALDRSEAVGLAYDVLDRIRANPGGSPPGALYDGLRMGAAPPDSPDCTAEVCSPEQMAAFDQRGWKCALGAFRTDAGCEALRVAGLLPASDRQPGLPGGDGSIEVTAEGQIAITVTWQDANGEVQQVVVGSQP